MPIEIIARRLYQFIKEYGETHKVSLTNIRLWARHVGITQQEMGYALQTLKWNHRVYFSQQKGWMVR